MFTSPGNSPVPGFMIKGTLTCEYNDPEDLNLRLIH